ncbi:unnamed protein product [Phytophthora fragariaefolia]|uniref:Unnamed protein product n=1 Tax=Phytophthora fragariaefolia TaxID=1490495 RepID=A0A9W7D247_9STRA|nr:unnamed protein product [Phytophthora fragariaefolia]
MPFGLKNAPLVYQAVINNCLWGFVRLSPNEEAEVDQDVLEFLGLDPSKREDSGSQVSVLTDTVTVFQRNIPAPASMGPVLGRGSYIDDIAHGAPTWDQLCDEDEDDGETKESDPPRLQTPFWIYPWAHPRPSSDPSHPNWANELPAPNRRSPTRSKLRMASKSFQVNGSVRRHPDVRRRFPYRSLPLKLGQVCQITQSSGRTFVGSSSS